MKILARGIDVSSHNGLLDWNIIKPQIDYAILRVGYGMDIKSQDDSRFERNAAECERLGIPFGTYIYSYATSLSSAESEARHMLRLMKGKKSSYPVYYDLEDENTLGKQSNADIAKFAERFCDMLEDEGYFVGIYANLYWYRSRLTSPVFRRWTKWIAQYNKEMTYGDTVGMWQHTDKGRLNGLSGYFDLNECYVDYPNIIVPKGFNNNEVQPEFQKGDVNQNGEVTAIDARLALRASANLEKLSPEQEALADMNEDGKVTAVDARSILRQSAGLESKADRDEKAQKGEVNLDGEINLAADSENPNTGSEKKS